MGSIISTEKAKRLKAREQIVLWLRKICVNWFVISTVAAVSGGVCGAIVFSITLNTLNPEYLHHTSDLFEPTIPHKSMLNDLLVGAILILPITVSLNVVGCTIYGFNLSLNKKWQTQVKHVPMTVVIGLLFGVMSAWLTFRMPSEIWPNPHLTFFGQATAPIVAGISAGWIDGLLFNRAR